MKQLSLLVIGMSASLAASALAADKPAKPEKPAKAEKAAVKGPKPAKMTCEDFIALDEVSKPKLVYWAEGFNRKGKPDDAVFDVDTTDRLVPVLVEVCTKAPKESFWKKAKEEFKKIF